MAASTHDAPKLYFLDLDSLRPDVVLLDIRLQSENGIEICRRIKSLSPPPRVLILTSYVDEQSILAALEAARMDICSRKMTRRVWSMPFTKWPRASPFLMLA